jgi:hypothetical protein
VTIWARPPGPWSFCAVLSVGASVLSHCGGRWVPSDEDELRWTPPAGQRCEACWAAVERLRQDLATLERLRDDLGAGPFQARYPEDVARAQERAVVEMERFEAELPDPGVVAP